MYVCIVTVSYINKAVVVPLFVLKTLHDYNGHVHVTVELFDDSLNSS